MKWYVLLPLVFLTGCNYLDNYRVMFRKDWEQEKQKIESKHKSDTAALLQDINNQQKIKEQKEQTNLQKASGLAFGINQISEIKPADQRSRPETLINLKSRDLVTLLPALSPEDVLKVNEELRKELDEKLTSLKDLQKKYDDSIDENIKSKNEIAILATDISKKQDQIKTLEADKQSALLQLADKIKISDEEANRKLKAELEQKEQRDELIKYLIKIFVGIGVLASIGAYAVRSITLTTAALAAFTFSAVIAFLKPWMMITGGVIVLVSIVAGIIIHLYTVNKNRLEEKQIADNLVGSIEEFKSKIGNEKFKQDLAPYIKDWMKDIPKADDKIKGKLKDLNLL